MIQILPNELHIQILTFVVTETNFENFCALRTVCKKWNTFVPLVMHEAVISKLNSGLNLELTDWNETKWSKKLSPTYDDNTKAFTFLFDSADATKSFYDREKSRVQNISFTAFVKRSEDVSIPHKLGYKFGDLAFPEFVNSDIDKYEFDHQSNVCFKRETKVGEEGKDINFVRLHSFTIAAWKLCYILDCLKSDRKHTNLRNGFYYYNNKRRMYCFYVDDMYFDTLSLI